MPLYYFDVDVGFGEILPDEEGESQTTPMRAFAEAAAIARDLACEWVQQGRNLSDGAPRVIVRNAERQTLLEVPFAQAFGPAGAS